jgi:hypothetical protein
MSSDETFLIGKPLKQDLKELSDGQLQDLLDFANEVFRLTDDSESFKETRIEWEHIQRLVLNELEKRYLLS